MRVTIDLDDAASHYLQSSARIRRVSAIELVKRIVGTVVEEQMILSVLDDDSERGAKGNYTPPTTNLYAGLRPHGLTPVQMARTQR